MRLSLKILVGCMLYALPGPLPAGEPSADASYYRVGIGYKFAGNSTIVTGRLPLTGEQRSSDTQPAALPPPCYAPPGITAISGMRLSPQDAVPKYVRGVASFNRPVVVTCSGVSVTAPVFIEGSTDKKSWFVWDEPTPSVYNALGSEWLKRFLREREGATVETRNGVSSVRLKDMAIPLRFAIVGMGPTVSIASRDAESRTLLNAVLSMRRIRHMKSRSDAPGNFTTMIVLGDIESRNFYQSYQTAFLKALDLQVLAQSIDIRRTLAPPLLSSNNHALRQKPVPDWLRAVAARTLDDRW